MIKHKITTILEDIETNDFTPVGVLENLIKKFNSNKFFLFESNEKNHSNYSFLGINPIETLIVKEGVAFVEKENTKSIINGDILEIISNFINKYDSNIKNTFIGGTIGYISYDFVKYLENIQLPNINTFNENEAYLMMFKNIIIFDHIQNKITIAINIFNENPSLKEKNQASKDLEELKNIIKLSQYQDINITNNDNNSLDIKTSFGKEKFLKAVKKVKSHIKGGDIFQCVLSERFSFDLDIDPLLVYKVLRKINPSPYLFYISADSEIILGSSPEMLVKSDSKKISLCPIAGTKPRGKDLVEDEKYQKALLKSSKEKAEHLMLVDLGRNDLGRVSKANSVKVKDFMKVEKFSHVMHLVSLVEGELQDNKNSFDAFNSVFPAGTLSGAPKVRAMQIISELEPVKRGVYGGSIFCHSFSGYMDSCITIRSLYIKDKKAYIQAGAGIVADSNPESEYQEIENKSKAVLNAVNIAKKLNSYQESIK
jgi:anthranilate synthase component 1